MSRRNASTWPRAGSLVALLLTGCAAVTPMIQEQISREATERAGSAIEGQMPGDSMAVGEEAASDSATPGDSPTPAEADGSIADRIRCASEGTECPDAGESSRPGPRGAIDPAYDFEPGDRVLLDQVITTSGDVPDEIEVRAGSWDVVEQEGRRWLRNTGPRHAAVTLPLPETLPESFTIEFELRLSHPSQRVVVAATTPDGPGLFALPGNAFQVGAGRERTGIIVAVGSDGVQSLGTTPEVAEAPTRVRIMVEGARASLYVGDRAVARVEDGSFERGAVIYFENAYYATESDPLLIGPIRVAARDLPDAGGAE